VTDDAIEIRAFVNDDLDAVVAFSLRAWEPVFASVHAVLGDEIFLRLHPDWRAGQAETVRSICTSDERDVFIAAVGARPVGFVAVALNVFHDRMGAIEIIGVDPDHQRRGIGERLTEFALDHMSSRGMDIAVWRQGAIPAMRPLGSSIQPPASRSCRSLAPSDRSANGRGGGHRVEGESEKCGAGAGGNSPS
jgi:ribosomal protein S18 acetylase RimI-like enzyme